MKCVYCNNEFTKDDAENENMTPRWINDACVPVHMECPETTYAFKYYFYDNSERSEIEEYLTDPDPKIAESRGCEPLPQHVAEDIAMQLRRIEVSIRYQYLNGDLTVVGTRVS